MGNEFLEQTFHKAKKGKHGCLFCQPFDGMALYETQNFRILLDTFPVAEGHLMITSKDHYGSGGEIPPELFFELTALKEELQDKMMQTDRSFIFYEHGRAGCCLAKSPNENCKHFHLHCVPIDVSIRAPLNERFEEFEMDTYSDISPLFLEHGDYLYFEDVDQKKYFYPIKEENIEEHLLRTLVCDALFTPDLANWENFTDLELYLKSCETAKNILSPLCMEANFGLL